MPCALKIRGASILLQVSSGIRIYNQEASKTFTILLEEIAKVGFCCDIGTRVQSSISSLIEFTKIYAVM